MAIKEPVVLTAEQIEYRSLLSLLKAHIKLDIVGLRAAKVETRALKAEAAVAQSQLARARVEARARLLVYGVLRGRTWQQIETNPKPYGQLAYFVAACWNKLIPKFPLVTMPAEIKENDWNIKRE